MRQEFEFRANQREAQLNEQINLLEKELASEREKNETRHQQMVESRMVRAEQKMEEKRI